MKAIKEVSQLGLRHKFVITWLLAIITGSLAAPSHAATVSVAGPSGTISAPFDITGTATFKPTPSSYKGVIYGAILNSGGYVIAGLPLKVCSTENCAYSYLDIMGRLYDMNHGGPYRVWLIAFGVGDAASASAKGEEFMVDKTPTVSVTGPSGTISAPVDITGTATFKPTLNDTKGIIYGAILNSGGAIIADLPLKTCSTENCSYSYQDIMGELCDIDHGGPYTVKLIASGSGASASAQGESFRVDKTPTVRVTGPSGTVSAPFEISGTVTFKPTLNSTKGIIYGAIRNSGGSINASLPSKICSTDNCAYSYLDITGRLYDMNKGGPYKVKLEAGTFSGGYASDEKTFTVEDGHCTLDVTDFSGISTTISPLSGGRIKLSGSISDTSGKSIDWTVTVAGRTYRGTGKTVTVIWDGKDSSDKIVEPGAYTATLLAKTSDGKCADAKTLKITVTSTEDCKRKITFGSTADAASGNLHHSQVLFTTANQTFDFHYNSTDGHSGPLGRGWSHSYEINVATDEDGNVVLREGDGKYRLYQPSENGYTSQQGDYSTLIKNADGTFTIIHKDGQRYNFNNINKIASIADRNNNAITFTHTNGDLTTITDSAGRRTTLTYNADHRIAAISDPNGNVHSFVYSGNDLIGTTTQPGGSQSAPTSWTYTYYDNSFMKTKTDPNGYTTTYTYDEEYRVATSTDPEGNVKSITYPSTDDTSQSKTTTVTEKDGGVWTYTYDTEAGTLTQKTDPENGTTSYTYDENRNMTSKTEADGSVTSYTYDTSGNMTSTTDALNQTTTYTYNSYGQATSITAPDGTTTSYEYDTKGNLTKTTDSAGAITSYQYDSKGNVTSITNSAGQTTRFTYDQSNNLSSVTDPTGATTSFTYDAAGNMTSQTDASGNTTRFEYNSLGRLIKVIDPSGNSTNSTYDANGNKTSETDANGNTTYYEYNYKGQLIKVKDALGSVTTYIYGGTGCSSCGGGTDKLTVITDANGNETKYEYDKLGRLTKETDHLGNAISYSYDSKGNLTSKTDAIGATTSYSYDSLGRLLKKTYPDSTTEIFSYDAKGNILTATNANASYTFSYNTSGKVASVADSNSRTVSYSYDSLGNKAKLIYPEGSTVTYSYDSANRLKSIVNGGGKTYAFTYDSLGRRSKLSLPNGTSANYSYDSSGRLTGLSHKTSSGSTIASFAYTHDKVGNRLTKTEAPSPLAGEGGVRGNADVKHTYIYDVIYRLTEALSSTPGYSSNTNGKGSGVTTATQQQNEFYTYDPVGNRLSSDKYSSYTYNQANQLLSNGGTYNYDKNGNLTSKIEGTTVFSYLYDYENRLTKVVKVENSVITTSEFKYDPFGRRIEKKVTEGGTAITTRFIYDNEDIILEYDGSGNIGNRYIHGPGIDEPFALINNQGNYYYHSDGLGSIVALTDSKGKVVQAYEYDSFGNLKDQKNRIKQPYAFMGREWDRESGTYHYRRRTYDPKPGRFTQPDPLGFKGGDVNLYAAFSDNPINNIDPSGMTVWRCTRPLNGFPNSDLLLRYLGIGHRYLWFDNPGIGYGLAPQEGYGVIISTTQTVPAHILRERRRVGQCTIITSDSCMEQKMKDLIATSESLPLGYNLINYNCYHWANSIEWAGTQ